MASRRKRYRLYIDESGDHTYKYLHDLSKRYLGLCGIIVEGERYRTSFYPAIEALKQDHFPHNPDHPVILHRRDIMDKKGPYWRLREKENEKNFNADLLDFLRDEVYKVVTVVIDKQAHIERYGKAAFHPYDYCVAVMLERYCGLLQYMNAVGDVLAESRGRTHDTQLKEAYIHIYRTGTQFREASFFQGVLTSKEIKIKRKEDNIAGLQVADLLAYPCKRDVLIEVSRLEADVESFGHQICECIEPKYNRRFDTGRIRGYGRVFLG